MMNRPVGRQLTRARYLGGCLAVLLAALLGLAPAASAAAPRWEIDSMSDTTTAAPNPTFEYLVEVKNVGDADSDGSPVEVRAELPPGLLAAEASLFDLASNLTFECHAADGVSPVAGASAVLCVDDEPVPYAHSKRPIGAAEMRLTVEIPAGASGTLLAHFSVGGGGAAAATTVDPTRVSASAPPFGVDAFDTAVLGEGGAPDTQAGSHPAADLTNFDMNTVTEGQPLRGSAWPVEPLRGAVASLPPGLVGNPQDIPAACTAAQLANSINGFGAAPLCPPESQVGTVVLRTKPGALDKNSQGPFPLFRLKPPPGAAAAFGFNIVGTVVELEAHVRNGSDYGITVGSTAIPAGLTIVGNEIEFWGDPSAEAHDRERACPGHIYPAQGGPIAGEAGCETPYTRPAPEAFLRNPTSCTAPGEGLTTAFDVESWLGHTDRAASVSHQSPGYPYPPSAWGPPVGIEGCAAEPFSPALSAVPPAGAQAGEPTGLSVDLSMPQQGLEEPGAISEADLRSATVTLPAGMALNPSSAGGLGACTPAQVGLTTPVGRAHAEFDTAATACPEDSRIGAVTITTPLLDHTLEGSVYLAAQGQNPFGSLTALYMVVTDPASGLELVLPGKVSLDPATGQVTTSFEDNPQLPFTHLHLELKGGPRAPLIAPPCGSYADQVTLVGWGGQVVQAQSPFQIGAGCGGGFHPGLAAGTADPVAGQTSPFSLRLTRADGEDPLGGLTATLPPGLSGYLAGIPYCPDAVLAAISGAEGTGRAEEASPSCPAASLLGRVTVGAGAGPDPFYTAAGRVYLAGPYKGAPLSLAVVAPAVAGPFDLGSVVVRNALQVNPVTAQITAVSDPFPTILHGIPLDLRDVRVELDRPHFTLNPTSCEPMQIGSTISSSSGASASPAVHFQVGDCAALGFRPKLAIALKGRTTRAGHPALRATLTMPPAGQSNIARATVSLPHSEFLAQGHLGNVCTRVQYAEGGGGGGGCPANSVYGHAVAYSPLLEAPLEGDLYLRANGGERKLPDLVASLGGQIHVDLVGYVDSNPRTHGLRTSFATAPDAPVSKFVLTMPAGRHSLLENSTNICHQPGRAIAVFSAHDASRSQSRPKVAVAGCGKGRKGHAHRHRHGGRHHS